MIHDEVTRILFLEFDKRTPFQRLLAFVHLITIDFMGKQWHVAQGRQITIILAEAIKLRLVRCMYQVPSYIER